MSTPKRPVNRYRREDLSTPVKGRTGECVVCGKTDPNQRLIHSKAGNAKELSSLIEDYVGVSVVGGSLCRSCESKLLTIDKKVLNIQGEYSLHVIGLSYTVRVTMCWDYSVPMQEAVCGSR